MHPSGHLLPLPTASAPVSARASSSAPYQRAGDLERNAVCSQLASHFAAGRLSAEELDARLGAAVAAPTLVELRWLLADLPAPAPRAPHPVAPRRAWSGLDVVALLAVIGALVFAGIMTLVLVAFGGAALVLACFLGGSVAAVGGGALTHLVHRGAQQVRGAGASPDGQRPRIA
jgi:hypothetical protein